MPTTPPAIFNEAARRAKRMRARDRLGEHDFLHMRAAEDVVDRLEAVLRRFDRAVFFGPAARHVKDALTPAADVGEAITVDDIPGADIVAEPTALPLDAGSMDLVVSAMAMQAVNDPVAVMREALRVLKPDGLFVAIFPGERTLHELRAALREAETSVLGGLAPRVAPMMAVKDGGALLQAAGFALPVADVDHVTIEYSEPGRLFSDLRGAGETSTLVEAPKGALRRDVLAAALSSYLENYPGPEGGIVATVDLLTLTGWKPHPAQQKPLAPGSATSSLEEAVKTATPDQNTE